MARAMAMATVLRMLHLQLPSSSSMAPRYPVRVPAFNRIINCFSNNGWA